MQRLNILIKDARYISAIAELSRNLEQTKDILSISRLTKLKKLALTIGKLTEANMVTALMTAFLRENVTLEHFVRKLLEINITYRHQNHCLAQDAEKTWTDRRLWGFRRLFGNSSHSVAIAHRSTAIFPIWLRFQTAAFSYSA